MNEDSNKLEKILAMDNVFVSQDVYEFIERASLLNSEIKPSDYLPPGTMIGVDDPVKMFEKMPILLDEVTTPVPGPFVFDRFWRYL